MIIDKKTKRFQTRSDKPNSFWLTNKNKNDFYIIDDNSELAKKIKENYPNINFILDEKEQLIDVEIDTVSKQNRQKIKDFQIQIKELKKQLSTTDYQAIKYAEGQLSEEEFLEIKIKRQSWRDEINNLEKKIEELKAKLNA